MGILQNIRIELINIPIICTNKSPKKKNNHR